VFGHSYTNTSIIANLESIYRQQAELGEAHEQLKKHQNTLLDMYDPNCARLDALLRELVELEREVEELDKEFESLHKLH
jgi:hypothetical protein